MKLKFPIKSKVILMVVAFALMLSSVSLLICGRVMAKTVNRQYTDNATSISATVAKITNSEELARVKDKIVQVFNETENRVSSEDWGTNEFYEYIALYTFIENDADYKSLIGKLKEIQNVNNVDCLYYIYLDVPTESFVYIADASEDEACPPGCFDPLYDVNKGLLTDPTIGFPAYITDTEEYGALVTAGAPVYGGDGSVIGYAMVDISMKDIRTEVFSNILRLAVFLAIATVLIIIISTLIINQTMIKPLKKLSASAAGYYTDDDSSIERNEFAKLNITTGDEISALADSMKKMENDLNTHIKKLLSANSQLSISKSVANRMTELATKDPLTGLRNKTAYDFDMKTLDRNIKEGLTEIGIAMIDLNFLKQTNDTFGHERGNAALISLGNIICGVFEHSSVFRIGGDEFAVILSGSDYKNIKELEKEFNDRISYVYNDMSLDPWLRVSAAIGCALYDAKHDSGVTDVFNRADSTMYENKRRMKASGIKPFND